MQNRIRPIRELRGLSLAAVAVAMFGSDTDVKSVSSQLSKLERGDTALTLQWMQRFAKVLGVSPADLLSDEDNPGRVEEHERDIVHALRRMPVGLRSKAYEIVSVLAREDAQAA